MIKWPRSYHQGTWPNVAAAAAADDDDDADDGDAGDDDDDDGYAGDGQMGASIPLDPRGQMDPSPSTCSFDKPPEMK